MINSNVSDALGHLNARYHALNTSSKWLLLVLGLMTMVALSALALRPAALVDLGEGHHARKADFYSLWDKGSVVVLMRHVERCDHSTNPCLSQGDGITVKGKTMAQQVGKAFQALGVDQADIFNSPMRRTEQTATFAFNRATAAQDWLINCQKSMLNDVVEHKIDHRNLILVTHSECITALEKSLDVPFPTSPDYGTSLLVAVNPGDHKLRVLGYVDPQDWIKVIARRP